MERTSLQLFRDCLRVAKRVGGRTAKGSALRSAVRIEFEKHRDETDKDTIEQLKSDAVRGLSNYLIAVSPEIKERRRTSSGGEKDE